MLRLLQNHLHGPSSIVVSAVENPDQGQVILFVSCFRHVLRSIGQSLRVRLRTKSCSDQTNWHPPKATQQSVMESVDFGGSDEELTQRSQRRGSSRALDPDEFLAAMAKESIGKPVHSNLKASEDFGLHARNFLRDLRLILLERFSLWLFGLIVVGVEVTAIVLLTGTTRTKLFPAIQRRRFRLASLDNRSRYAPYKKVSLPRGIARFTSAPREGSTTQSGTNEIPVSYWPQVCHPCVYDSSFQNVVLATLPFVILAAIIFTLCFQGCGS